MFVMPQTSANNPKIQLLYNGIFFIKGKYTVKVLVLPGQPKPVPKPIPGEEPIWNLTASLLNKLTFRLL